MGKFTEYELQLAQLKDGRHEEDFHIDTEFFRNMENTEVISADVNVHMTLNKKGDLYDITFDCNGNMEIPCDRCLDPLDHHVDDQYHIVVKYGDEYNDESDELLVLPYSQLNLNIAPMLYDTLMLTIPLRHVHPDGECNQEMVESLSRHISYSEDYDASDSEEDADLELSDDPDSDL